MGDLTGLHWMAPEPLRKFNLYCPSSFSVFLACWFSRQPVSQASTMEHQRSILWKPDARIRSSKSLAHFGYLFMRANGSWAEGLSLIPTQNNLQGFAHPGQCCCLDCMRPSLMSWVLMGLHYPALLSHHRTLHNMFYTTIASLKYCELRIRSTVFSTQLQWFNV